MIEIGIIGSILLTLWLANSDINHKEQAKTSLCIGVCVSTEASVIDGNTHDEHDPSITKIVTDKLSGASPSTGEVK